MSSLLGFGGKCTCWFNIPVLSLTLTVWLLWVVLLFEKKSMKAFSMKIIRDRIIRTEDKEAPQMEIKPHGEVGFMKAASCVAQDLMEVSIRQPRNSSGMQCVQ